MNKIKVGRTFKAGVWYTIADFINRGFAFITMPIFTRLMSKEEMGQFSTFTSWMSILLPILTLNLSSSIVISKIDHKEDYNQYVSSVTIFGTIVTLLIYLISLPFLKQITRFLEIPQYAFNVMFVYLMFIPSSLNLVGMLRANMKYRQSVYISLLQSLLMIVFSVVCVLSFTDRLKGRIEGSYFTAIVFNIIIFLYIIIKGHALRFEDCKYGLLISLPLIIHNFSGNIIHSSDRIMIQKFCSSEDVAVYSVAYMCGMLINTIRNSMNAALFPIIYEKLEEGKEGDLRLLSYIYLGVFFLLCIGIIIFSPEVVLILGGRSYFDGAKLVAPIVVSYMAYTVYSLYAAVEQYYKKQKWFALFGSLSAILNILLNIIFIPSIGFEAAAYTTLAASIFETALHFLNVKRMKKNNVYNTSFNFLILVVLSVLGVIMVLVYNNKIARVVIIIAFLFAGAYFGSKYKNTIITLLRKTNAM